MEEPLTTSDVLAMLFVRDLARDGWHIEIKPDTFSDTSPAGIALYSGTGVTFSKGPLSFSGSGRDLEHAIKAAHTNAVRLVSDIEARLRAAKGGAV